MMKKINRRYSKISGLNELRLERSKLRMRLELKEYELCQDWANAKELFSFRTLMDTAIAGFSNSALFDGIMSGLETVRSFFGGRKRRR